MEFKKKNHKYSIDDISTKYITKYEGATCEPNSIQGEMYKIQLLKFLIDNHNNLDQNSKSWEKMTVKHNGNSWEIYLETTVEDKNI